MCSLLSIRSLGCSYYYILFTNDYNHWSWIYFMATKDESFDKFKQFHVMIKKHIPHKILYLRFNKWSEFIFHKFNEYLKENDILRQLSTTKTPHQNKVSKRKNCTIFNKIRVLLIGSKVLQFLWTKATKSIVQIINTIPIRANNDIMPNEVFFGIKSVLTKLCLFGCLCYVACDEIQMQKMDP